jgi:hypothetical protein
MPGLFQGGVKLPHSKAHCASSSIVVSRRTMKASLGMTACARVFQYPVGTPLIDLAFDMFIADMQKSMVLPPVEEGYL